MCNKISSYHTFAVSAVVMWQRIGLANNSRIPHSPTAFSKLLTDSGQLSLLPLTGREMSARLPAVWPSVADGGDGMAASGTAGLSVIAGNGRSHSARAYISS